MKSERGTTYHSHRHRPGHAPTSAESKTPERAVENSHRGAAASGPAEINKGGDFKRTPEHEAEARIGANVARAPAVKHKHEGGEPK